RECVARPGHRLPGSALLLEEVPCVAGSFREPPARRRIALWSHASRRAVARPLAAASAGCLERAIENSPERFGRAFTLHPSEGRVPHPRPQIRLGVKTTALIRELGRLVSNKKVLVALPVQLLLDERRANDRQAGGGRVQHLDWNAGTEPGRRNKNPVTVVV